MKDATALPPPSATEPSLAIVERIAELEGADPTELTPPLFDAIDPDALDSLFRSSSAASQQSETRVSFTYRGYDVDVSGEGDVAIAERD